MNERLRSLGILTLIGGLAGALAVGCDDDGEDVDGGPDTGSDAGAPAGTDAGPDEDAGPSDRDAGSPPTGRLRVWHLADGEPSVDVFIDGEAALTGFGFEDNTDYIELPAGTLDIAVAPAGMGIAEAFITVDDFALGADETWTIIAAQLDADPTAAGAFTAIPVQEDVTTPSADNIALRVFHAAYDVDAAVDIHSLNAVNLPELVDDLARGSVTDARIEVPNDAYGLGVDADDDGRIDLVTGEDLPMPVANARILIGAISKTDGAETETELVFLVNDGENIHEERELEPSALETTDVRFWHLAAEISPGTTGMVDIFVDGVAVATGVGFEDNTAYAPFLSGTYDIAIAPAGMTPAEALITAPGFTLGADQSFTIIAAQLPDVGGADTFTALPIEDDRSPPLGSLVGIRAFHAAYAVPGPVDIYDIPPGATPAIDDLAPGTATAARLEVPPGSYPLGLDTDNDGIVDFQTAMPIPEPPANAQILVGAISKPDGADTETELVYLVNDGPMIHEEVGLIPFLP